MTRAATRTRDEGSVLVLTLLLTLVILGLGLMAMWMASSATKASSKLARRQHAMVAVNAGLARARIALLRSLGTAGLPGFSAALQGLHCRPVPPNTRARMAAFVPGKGRIICDRGTAGRPAKLLLNVPVTPTEAAQHVVKVTEAARARFTAYVRNDSDEYRHCNGVLDHGERSDSGRCTGLRRGLSSAEQRALIDEDSRVILRIEGRGPDGLSFAAVEVVLSGASTRPLGNAYTQADGDALNSNATAGGAL